MCAGEEGIGMLEQALAPTELKQEAEQREEEGEEARAEQLKHTPTRLEEKRGGAWGHEV